MAMAKTAEVRKRIELILDETRQIPRAFTRARWAALLLCGIPIVWLASVAQLVPAAAQESPRTPAAMAEYLKGRRQLSPADVSTMEQYLVANPHDVDTRSQLILHYYANGVREPRIGHILWLIENHPEATQTIFASQGVLPRDNTLNSYPEYQRVLAAWKQAVATRKGDAEVLRNAARFLQFAGEFEQAEKLLLDAGALGTGAGLGPGLDQLARLYAAAILGATGDTNFQNPSPSFAARVRRDLEASENPVLLQLVSNSLRSAAMRPRPGQQLPPGMLNLDDHPLLLSAIDFGDRLSVRAQQLSPNTRLMIPKTVEGVRGGVVGGVPGGVPGGNAGGVLGGIISSVPATSAMPPPPTIKRVEPVYPPLARQARISGIVRLTVVIAIDGSVKQMNVVSGHPLLVPAALEAVRQWTFQAPSRELTTNIDVPFIMEGAIAPSGQFNGAFPLTPTRIKIGGNVQASKLVRKVDPDYPAQARAERIEGDVTVQIVISKAGKVIDATAVEGSPILAEAAIRVVWQWEYQPTLLNGEPVEVATTVTVPFRLQ